MPEDKPAREGLAAPLEPLPAFGEGEVPAAAALPEALPVPRFCRECGAPWDPGWTQCPRCAGGRLTGSSLPLAVSVPRPGGVRPALWLYFLLLSTSAVCIVLLKTEAATAAEAMLVTSLADTAIVGLWAAATFGRLRTGLCRTGGGGWYGAALGLACGTVTVATLAVWFLARTLRIEDIQYAQPFLDAGWGWGGVVALFCLQPAVVEELAFRGAILTGLQGVLSSRDAVIVSSMMFAILHLSVLSLPHLLLIGLVLGWLRLRTGSLYPGMLLHFTHNLLILLGEAAGI